MHAPFLKSRPRHIAILTALSICGHSQADETANLTLSPIVVTATRQAQNSFDLPVAIDVIQQHDIEDGQPQMFLSESLIRVPGITAQNRNNQAQDPQISTRGFGSRSSFGVRGVRVYVDGIPLTMPDGQGQPGVVDLAAIKSIEVMRGPFSSLYGNSSGGVIQLLTEDAPKRPTIGATTMFGSYDTKRNNIEAAGQSEELEYVLNVSNLEADGFRDHGKGNKKMGTAKFKLNVSEDTKITTLVNWFEQEAQDPLGLDRTRAFSRATRDQAIAAANLANTGVKRNHAQVGFNLEHIFDANNKLSFIPYVGTRSNAQLLTTTATATTLSQTNARLSGIERQFYGADLRWDHQGRLGQLPFQTSIGLTYGKSTDDRKDTNVLFQGAKINTANRNEQNISSNFDQYIQSKLTLTPSIDLHAGARHTNVRLTVKDNLSLNGDNSGRVEYQKTTPVVGVVWKATESVNLYANYGKGFETPTFVEAAFDDVTSGVASKPNLSLKAAESRNLEFGVKAYLHNQIKTNLTFFRINTENEIVTRQTVTGRSSFQNAGSTKRTGVEASIDAALDHNVNLFAAYTLLNATFEDPFTTVISASGTTGTVQAGNRIPGTYRNQMYAELAWKQPAIGFTTALEGRYNSKVYVNDINSDIAPSYTIFNLRAGFEQDIARWHFKEYLRIENMLDREYIGSVRVNDGNGLFYETGANRNFLLGLSGQYQF